MLKRSTTRTRTFLKAEINLLGNPSGLPCIVKDVSEAGARLILSDGVPLPDHLQIRIRDRSVSATVKWRRGDQVGVEFDDDAETPASSSESTLERVRALEIENARLRRLLEAVRADPSRVHQLLGLAA